MKKALSPAKYFKAGILLTIIVLCSGITYSQNHLQFDGIDSYITFGNHSSLGLSTFTLEALVKITGSGVTASSWRYTGNPNYIKRKR